MAGQGASFYRNDSSLTRNLQTTFESSSGLGYPPMNSLAPFEPLTPVGHRSLDLAHPSGLAGSMPPSQHWQSNQQDPVINQLFTRMDQMMTMISDTQRLLLAQQNSHSALEVKVDALSNRLLLMTDTTPASGSTSSSHKEANKPKIPVELSVSLVLIHNQ